MKHAQNYQGLIFDCDGTLVDTMPLHYISLIEAFKSEGVFFTSERFYKLGGIPLLTVVQLLAGECGVTLSDPAAFAERKEAIFIDMIDEINPISQTIEVVKSHHGHLPMAVASGSPRSSVELMLNTHDLMHYFEIYLGEEDVENGKPSPDVFLKAADHIGIEPEKCLVYEDADAGIEAARKAGMDVIDVREFHQPANVKL